MDFLPLLFLAAVVAAVAAYMPSKVRLKTVLCDFINYQNDIDVNVSVIRRRC